MSDDAEPTVVGGRPVLPRRAKWRLAAYLLFVVAFSVHLVWTRRWTTLVILIAFVAIAVVRNARPPTTVGTDGIRRPWSRQPFLPWALVDHVLQPGYEQTAVRIVTTIGRTIRLSGIDPSRTDEVAQIGDRPVQAVSIAAPKPVERERTQREIETDVARRAARLAEERRRMSGST